MIIVQFIILQVVFFGGVIFFLKKIMRSDTQGAISRMDAVYQDLVKKQKELTEKIAAAEKEYKQKKEEASRIKDQMHTEAVEEIRTKKDEMMKASRAEAEEIVKRAVSSATEMRINLEKEAKCHIVDYAADLARRALDPKVLTMIHAHYLQNFMERGKHFDLSSVIPSVDTCLIRTAYPLTKEAKDKISAMVTGKLGRTLNLTESVDEEVIAGIILQFGNVVVDGSFSNAIFEASEKAKQKIQFDQTGANA